MSSDDEPRRIQSADRVCDILEHIRETGRTTVSELAEAIGSTTGTAHTYLTTLESRGLVRKHEGEYRLGQELLPYGEHVRLESDLYQAAKAELHRFAHECDATAHLMSEYKGRLIILDEVFGENAIGREFHPRKRERPQPYLHCTSAGKAILAYLPDYRVAQILENHELVSHTPSTITDETELVTELENVRDRGFALNDQEHMQGIRAIGAPIHYNSERVVGAVSLSGSASNWHGERFHQELPQKVMRVANAIEVDLHSNLNSGERPLI